jgi:hypothetical protein
MQLTLISALLTSWFLSDIAFACVPDFVTSKPGHATKSSRLQSPNSVALAWSEGIQQVTPSVFHTTLYVLDNSTGRQEVIFRSELTANGQLRNFRNEPNALGSYDAYCPVDWLSDSRFLLVEHARGPQASDALEISAWVFDRATKAKRKLDTRQLKREIERYRIGKKFRDGLYYLPPIGWESATRLRIVLNGLPSPGEATDFGMWSVEMDGSKPKLIEHESARYKPLRFGKWQNPGP